MKKLATDQKASRSSALDLFGSGPDLLLRALSQCPQKMWLARLTGRRLSIHERIVRLADTEAQNYVLCRQFICAPRSVASMYDSAACASRLGYCGQSARDALSLIRRLRGVSHELLCRIPSVIWAHAVEFPRKGAMTLETWLERRARDIPEQAEEIQQIHFVWRMNNPSRRRSPVVNP